MYDNVQTQRVSYGKMKKMLAIVWMLFVAVGIWAQEYRTVKDLSYTLKTDAYSKERLKLDVYQPVGKNDLPVIVWFHGGGLEAGEKEIPARLRQN